MPIYRLRFDRKVTDISGREICEMFGLSEGHSDLSVAWWMLPPGAAVPESKDDRVHAVIVLSGRGRATIDGAPDDVAAGHAAYIPQGASFKLENTGREPLVCYAIAAPAGPAPVSRRSRPA